ncbi:MAG: multidrug effflux MFS transporter [Deltaproteobacteria bacterium]|nr:multidrug effflux MFS transporter [Deltaproteobacteria bacterium]
MERNKHTTLIAALAALTAITPLSIDMYLPGFPAIAKDLHAEISQVTLSLTSFFIGISVGQLFIGPLSDRYGRKKPLLTGLALYVLASGGCMVARSVQALIALRLLQALGGCAGMVITRAMVRDLFPVSEIAKVFSTLMLIMGVAPIIAPTLGGIITVTLGWRYLFAVLTVLSLILLTASARFLPESRGANTAMSLHPKHVVQGYIAVFQEPRFYTYALAGGFASAGMFAYISGSPFVFMKLFGISEKHYGWIFGLNALGLIAASQVNRLWLRTQSSTHIMGMAGTLQFFLSSLLVVGTWLHFLNAFGIFMLIFVYVMMQGFIFPNASALALEPFTRNAGSASALLGSLQMVSGALSSALVSYFHNGTALPMMGVLAVCSTISFTALSTGRAVVKRKLASAMSDFS